MTMGQSYKNKEIIRNKGYIVILTNKIFKQHGNKQRDRKQEREHENFSFAMFKIDVFVHKSHEKPP